GRRGHGLRNALCGLVASVAGRGLRRRGHPRRPGERRGARGRDRTSPGGARRARPAWARARAWLHLAARRRDHAPRLRGGGGVRVGMDVSALAQTRAGTARYVKALLRELPEVRRLSFGGAGRASTLLRDTLWYPFLIPRGGLDVLHCPTYRGPVRSRVPVVVTVHDLAVFRHPETFNRWTRTYSPVVVPQVLRAAARVIAVSEFTRSELVELLDVPAEKIRVVPNGVEDAFAAEGPAAEGDYILAVGTLEPRKNLSRVAEAARRADVELRVVGARGWGGVQVHGNGVRWLGEVPDEELARLYRR